MGLSREEIKSCLQKVKTTTVSVPEWSLNGQNVLHVRALLGTEIDAGYSLLTKETSEQKKVYGLCLLCISDDSGNRLFSDDDVNILDKSPMFVLFRIAKVAIDFNGFSSTSVEEAKGN